MQKRWTWHIRDDFANLCATKFENLNEIYNVPIHLILLKYNPPILVKIDQLPQNIFKICQKTCVSQKCYVKTVSRQLIKIAWLCSLSLTNHVTITMKLQDNHHWELPEVWLNKSPTTRNIRVISVLCYYKNSVMRISVNGSLFLCASRSTCLRKSKSSIARSKGPHIFFFFILIAIDNCVPYKLGQILPLSLY